MKHLHQVLWKSHQKGSWQSSPNHQHETKDYQPSLNNTNTGQSAHCWAAIEALNRHTSESRPAMTCGNYDVELWDTKALWAGKGSTQNRPVRCSVLLHPHSDQQMCSSQLCILSLADMPRSAKLAANSSPSQLHAEESQQNRRKL